MSHLQKGELHLGQVTRMGQVFYPKEADTQVPEGCDYPLGKGACMDGDGCRWCRIYYGGPEALGE